MADNRENDSGKQLWREAESFADICELTAKYIEGTVGFFPSYGESPDEETAGIAASVAGFNRAGFLTVHSQPGMEEGEVKQRASVEGYVLEPVAKALDRLPLYSDLIVLVFPPDGSGGYQIPITVFEFRPFTWTGWHASDDELKPFVDFCGTEAFKELLQACYIIIIDPCWGRNDYLWEHVSRELAGVGDTRYSPDPHPELQIGIDFLGRALAS